LIIDFKNQNTKYILDYFRNNDISDKVINIEILETDLQKIGYKSWIDLAQIFFFKLIKSSIQNDTVILTFEKLNQNNSFHKEKQHHEKYGIDSQFFNIEKNNYFSFLFFYENALNFINIQNKKRILNLGVNKGDEFQVIKNIVSKENFETKKLIGIDYSNSVIKYAKSRFDNNNISFLCHDINKIDELNLSKFDLIITIGTLQSSNINFKLTFQSLIQKYLSTDGALVLGFPNCRWIDNEMVFGANVPHYNFSEMSLVIKDIYFCKKYLQQKKFKVTITGKDYIFLTARKIN
jgi:2-polyprenyl-3-methyl-5-hydroxy-6-metoxy-1,4-benzoquinol methylase